MTAVEEEFAKLVADYETAQFAFDEALPRYSVGPTYWSDNGYHTPQAMQAYKQADAEFKVGQLKLGKVKERLTTASEKLDEWIPGPVKGGIIVTPYLDAYAAIWKEGDRYHIVRSHNKESISGNVTSYKAQTGMR